MQRLLLVAFFVVSALTGCQFIGSSPTATPDGVTWIKTVSPPAGSAQVPYQQFELDNGLTVLLHQDHSDPLVNVDMRYHVGSAREEPGKSGFAHFFEHMMFEGSEHVDDHGKRIKEVGGYNNGSTNRDTTQYYQTVPANELERVLWLESDRMGFLLDAVSQRKFEVQRDTVKNERAFRIDNVPYGRVNETLNQALYPDGHPYSWPVIGYVEDLDRVDVSDLKQFFLRWYGPNNATLTVGGDIDVQQTLAWVNKYFGDIPSGPSIPAAEPQPVTLDANRFVTLEDKVSQPVLVMRFPTGTPETDTSTRLSVLANILGQGRDSVLYQSLVQTGQLLSAGASHQCGELACTFEIYGVGSQEQSLAEVRTLLRQSMTQFESQGVSPDDITPIKAMVEADNIFALQSVDGKVSQLASDYTLFGDASRLEPRLSRLDAVNPHNVMASYQQWVKNQPAVTLSVVPEGRTDLVAEPANFIYQRPDYRQVTDQHEADTLALRQTPVDFDRYQIPPPNGSVTVNVPIIYRADLDNGIHLAGTVSRETPTVTLQLSLPAGVLMEPNDKRGVANLTAQMITEGAAGMSAAELTQALDKLGSQVSVNPDSYHTTLTVTSLKKHLGETLKLVNNVLSAPTFAEQDFARVKNQLLESMASRADDAGWLSDQAINQLLYQDATFRAPQGGVADDIAGMTVEDVKRFYRRHYVLKGSQLVVVGDLSREHAINLANRIKPWQRAPEGYAQPARAVPRDYDHAQIWLVDKPQAPQTSIRMVRHGMPYDATGAMYQTRLANFNLGGNFNARLNQNLRQDKGYTYGAHSGVYGGRQTGTIEVSTDVRADASVDAIKELWQEMAHVKENGFTAQELTYLRQSSGQQDALRYETPWEKAGLIAHLEEFELDDNYREAQKALLQSLTLPQLNAQASRWFDPNDYQIVVVGDAARLRDSLRQLGLPVNTLTLDYR
ncbi:pitrilysin family protein [Salinivibrio sp. ES.052]|uniref:M16 family metallopeptidase n=1 Tax=Salinivibrio sp. ES.052 TaxID=1882823 RepID=UPI000929F37B|nr:pitrilysin family protein [Salinivibrio sp. ES.052]SIO02467.1 zinc protease [Salinivibrio sp. ES.052]